MCAVAGYFNYMCIF